MRSGWHRWAALPVVLGLLATAHPTLAAPRKTPQPLPDYRLLPLPTVSLRAQPPPTPKEAARIRALIARLAEIDSPDFGLSASMSGTAFAPIAGSEQAGVMVLGNHGLKRSEPLVELVKLGPRALPFLVQSIDDRTPTKLTMKLEGILSWMGFSAEAGYNPAIPRERKAVAALPADEHSLGEARNSHAVTVGDVCFVAIGQITGRGYEAVRYQPTGGLVVNSPTETPQLAKAVREIWSGDNPTKLLLNTLLTDYSMRGVHDGTSFDHWSIGEGYQSAAAMRLLYYFPRETAPLIARRLRGLHVQAVHGGVDSVSTPRQLELWARREVSNGVRTDYFLKAVAWCREPEVQSALVSLFQRTDDPDLLLASLTAVPQTEWALIRDRFAPALARTPRAEDGWYGDGYKLLVALYQRGGERARPLFRQYLRRASAQRCASVCEALRETRGEWDHEFLLPLLRDKRPTTYSHPLRQGAEQPRRPIRVCDQAALVLAAHLKDARFEIVGSDAEMDRKIARLRARWMVSRK